MVFKQDISVATEYKKTAQTDKLQNEIDMLKEQLQLTKSQLEAAQHAHAVRFSKVQYPIPKQQYVGRIGVDSF